MSIWIVADALDALRIDDTLCSFSEFKLLFLLFAAGEESLLNCCGK